MSNETIRTNLVDAINEMTRLLEVCEDPNQLFALRIKIRELFHKLDRIIVSTLDSSSVEFDDALKSLKELTRQARDAREDIQKISATIEKAAEAVTKVEKLVKGVFGVLAIL